MNYYIIFTFSFCLTLSSCSDPIEKEAWQKVKGENRLGAVDTFLKKYPNGDFFEEAQALKESFLWAQVQSESTIWYYLNYIQQFPQGEHSEAVQDLANSFKNDSFTESELLDKIFVGSTQADGGEKQLLTLQINEVRLKSDTFFLKGFLNSGDLKNDVGVLVSATDNSVEFREASFNRIDFIKAKGRLYKRNGTLFIESVNLNQYFKLVQ